jgi:hypothetical protein
VWFVRLTGESAARRGWQHPAGGLADWTFLEPRVTAPGLGSVRVEDGLATLGRFGTGNLRPHSCPAVAIPCRYCGAQVVRLSAAGETAPVLIVDAEPDEYGTVVVDESGLAAEDATLTVPGVSYRLHYCLRTVTGKNGAPCNSRRGRGAIPAPLFPPGAALRPRTRREAAGQGQHSHQHMTSKAGR